MHTQNLMEAIAYNLYRSPRIVASKMIETVLETLAQTRLDGTYLKWISGISANKLLILDDFGLKALNNDARIALLDILEEV